MTWRFRGFVQVRAFFQEWAGNARGFGGKRFVRGGVCGGGGVSQKARILLPPS